MSNVRRHSMSSLLVQALQAFADPHSEAQLQALDVAVQEIAPASCAHAEFQAMFGVFERFPSQDGYGVFWGILHALEACDGYELELRASVQRKPCEFNVLMVNRLLNAGRPSAQTLARSRHHHALPTHIPP